MLPYITALLLLLTVMTGAVFFMAVSLSRRAVRAATDADVEADDDAAARGALFSELSTKLLGTFS